jgi:hypothetical protein
MTRAAKPIIEYTWAKIWNSRAFNACTKMPSAGHRGHPERAANQARDGVAAGSAVARQQVIPVRGTRRDGSWGGGHWPPFFIPVPPLAPAKIASIPTAEHHTAVNAPVSALHLSTFTGGDALGHFRAGQLLARLQGVDERIVGVAARFVHLVATDAPLDDASRQRWAALLTYGEPYRGPTEGVRIVVTPRLGTVSPWASKATDIARNCGLSARRVERVVEYWLTLQAPGFGGAFRKRPCGRWMTPSGTPAPRCCTTA